MGGRPSTKSKAKLPTGGQRVRFITEKETVYMCICLLRKEAQKT